LTSGTDINITPDNTTPGTPHLKVTYYPLASEQAQRFDTVAQSWTGYHTATCEFSRNSGSFGDFADDASCSLTERSNTNMGSVVTVGSTGPGIVFSPNSAGKYKVCAKGSFGSNTLADTVSLRMVDGAGNVLSGGPSMTGGGVQWVVPFSVCADLVVASVASQTVKLQGKNSGGNFVQINPNAVDTESTIEWSIDKLDQQTPAPVIGGGVTSSGAGILRVEHVYFSGAGGRGTNPCTASPCTLYDSTPAITSVARTGTGSYEIAFSPGTFSSPPVCVCSGILAGVSQNAFCTINSAGATATLMPNVLIYGNGGGLADGGADVICMGPK
jgi:hypothetical protein